MSDTKDTCYFCGKSKQEVKSLIKGASSAICDECVSMCNEILEEEAKASTKGKEELPRPREICQFLDQYVISQDDAKRMLSVAAYNHYKRLVAKNKIKDDAEIKKSNILVIGPSGSGKTLLAETLARLVDVPCHIDDASGITQQGYVGRDPEEVILGAYNAAGKDKEKTEKGIIFLDEVDKIARAGGNNTSGRDISGEGVQQSLLKIIEGTKMPLPMRLAVPHQGNNQNLNIVIDTANILFICGGAFVGLEKIIERRLAKSGIGFLQETKTKYTDSERFALLKQVETEDLVSFGLIPEFVGRLPIIVVLNELNEVELVRVLTEPKDALAKQYKKLFEIDGIELEYAEGTLEAIGALAVKRKTGARGLRAILEQSLKQAMFEAPDRAQEGFNKCVLTKEALTSGEVQWVKSKKKAA